MDVALGCVLEIIRSFFRAIHWLVKRLLMMRRVKPDPYDIVGGQGFAARFQLAHCAILAEEERRWAWLAWTKPDPRFSGEIQLMHEVARDSAHLPWDYDVYRSLPARARRWVGYVLFCAVFVLLLFPTIMLQDVDPVNRLSGGARAIVIIACLALSVWIAYLVGCWSGAWKVSNLCEQGRRLCEDGYYKAGIRLLRRAVARHPQSLSAGYALASALVQTEKLEEAVEQLKGLRTIYPDAPSVLGLTAQIHHAVGVKTEASRLYDLAASGAERDGAPLFAQWMRASAAICRETDEDVYL